MRQLNQKWNKYAREAMRSAATPEEAAWQLELHGCVLAVKQHRNPQFVGLEGIVVRYSKQAFHLVSQKDRPHVVPRLKDCRFQVTLEKLCIVLQT